ncbi:MAG: DUF4276 family protein [Deltaproteobacteria bacterium]|nr:DUF4276 family protein [Deltaproteobacteria bacterium]
MIRFRIAAIVEGHGEVEAVPILIRRIAADRHPDASVDVNPVLRVPASLLRKEGDLERRIEYASRKLGGRGAILVLLDCDWEDCCPAEEAPRLLLRARNARGDLPVAVVLAKREYEAWFIASAESLRGKRRLPPDLLPAVDAEAVRGAKEWLSQHMPRQAPYAETTDQPAMTALFDMAAARGAADSFDKCYREIAAILDALS